MIDENAALLSDATWVKLKALSALPDEARADVDRVIFRFRRGRTENAEQRLKLVVRRAKDQFGKSIQVLNEMIEIQAWQVVRPVGEKRLAVDDYLTPSELESIRDHLAEIKEMAVYAERSMEEHKLTRWGPKSSRLNSLVFAMQQVVKKHTGS